MSSLRDRLSTRRLPSLLTVEAALALCPYLAALAIAVGLRPMLLDPARTESAVGPALVVGLLAAAAALALAGLLVVHAAIDVVRLVREWPLEGDATPRRIGHAAARVAETAGAVAFLAVVVVGVDALSGDIPSPAGVGVLLLFGGAYLGLSGVVLAHGIGRLLFAALEK